MTGRSNSATTSRMMWMLSASSARRWSRRRAVAVGSGDTATVDIPVLAADIGPPIKKPGIAVPGFDRSVQLGVFCQCPEELDRKRGDPEVLIQQHAHGQHIGVNTVLQFYSHDAENPNRGSAGLRCDRAASPALQTAGCLLAAYRGSIRSRAPSSSAVRT